MQARKYKPLKLSNNLYQLGTTRFPVYLSMGKIGMLIEGGTGGTAGLIAEQIAQLGIDPADIRYVALTHSHADHIGAVPRWRQMWPHLQVVAGIAAARHLSGPNGLAQFLPADRMISKILVKDGTIAELPEVLEECDLSVDRPVADGEAIDLGNGVSWQALETPGHSACHLSYYDHKAGVMAMGDMTGYYDPELEVIWPNYFHSLDHYIESIQRVATLPIHRGLLSHNGAVDGKVWDFLTRSLKETSTYHQQLLERVKDGEEADDICRQQAGWVYSFAPIASEKAIQFLCGALLKQSKRAEAEATDQLSPAARVA